MAFTYQGMTLQSFATQYLGSQDAMTDVRFRAHTCYGRCIDPDYTYIVQQSRLFNELFIGT